MAFQFSVTWLSNGRAGENRSSVFLSPPFHSVHPDVKTFNLFLSDVLSEDDSLDQSGICYPEENAEAFIIIHISFVPWNSWSRVQIEPTLNKLFVVAPEESFRPAEAVLGA